MTNLTDKWKKGELPDGWYYKTSILGNITIADISTLNKYRNRPDWEDIITILAPVPSFEEYQELLSDQLAKSEGVEINAELEKENTKLKELLKECVELMGDGTTYMHIDVYQQRKKDVLNAINQVLGEE